jgi:quinol monooxygenase YgiN
MGSNAKELVVLATALTALERWASTEDHQHHLQGDHVKALMARFEGVLAGPPEIAVRTPL